MVNLNKYNQEKFVNREQPLAIIHEKLQKLSASPAPKESELIHFWGMGGRGKSFLKRQIKTIYKDNNSGPSRSNYLIIDWDGHALLNKAYSVPEILIYFRNEFARYGFEMKRFTKFITYYRKCTSTSLPDIIDEHEESITKSIFKGIFSFISQSTGFGAAIDGIIDISQTSSRRKENKLLKQEYEDFSNLEAETMVTVLLEAFIKDINQEIKDRKIIFIIDTFEDIRSINLSFIFSRKTEYRHIPGLFYALQSSLWIVFGRDKTKFNDNQVSYQLNNFDIEETLTYMRENLQNIPEDNINQVISYSRGWPLLLSELHYELSSTHGNITTEFFDELKSEQAAQQVIKNRYKKYFSKDFNDEQNINLLKILFAFRQWTIHKENMTDSDLYKFTQEYYENALQTINITSKLQQLFKLSFINKLTEPKRSTTYEIDRSVYSALYDQTIDGQPVIPDTLKENVITFLLQKLSSKDEQVEGETANHNIRIDKNQAEVTQLIDLIFSYYDESTPNELFKHVMQILEDNRSEER